MNVFTLVSFIGFACWSIYGLFQCLKHMNFDAKKIKEVKILPIIGCILNTIGACFLPIALTMVSIQGVTF